MSSHRRILLVVAVVGLSTGCLGFLTGGEALAFSANRTVASDAALSETGYQEAQNQTVTNVVNVGVAGQQRQVNLTSYLYTYNRSVDVSDLNESQIPGLGGDATVSGSSATATPPAGADNATVPVGNASSLVSFAVLAMPNARVGGQSVHPLSRLSTEALVRQFLDPGDASVRFAGNHTVNSLDGERTVTTFRVEGQTDASDVLVHAATFDAGNDYVVVFAVHPRVVDERDRVDTLIASLEQPCI
jgi:hypothetical protein